MKDFEVFLEEAKPKLERAEYSQHPTEDLLTAYAYDQLDGALLSRTSAHVATCPVCRDRVDKLRSELDLVQSKLASALPDPVAAVVQKRESEQEGVERRAGGFAAELVEKWNTFTRRQRRSLYRQVTAYAAAAVFLFLLNIALDHLLIPPASPLASPAPINRWWPHLYWLLLPWGLFLIARGIHMFLSKKNERRRDDEK